MIKIGLILLDTLKKVSTKMGDQKKKLIHEPWESNARLLLKNMSHQNVCLLAWRFKGLIPPILRPYPLFGFLPLARLSQIPPI